MTIFLIILQTLALFLSSAHSSSNPIHPSLLPIAGGDDDANRFQTYIVHVTNPKPRQLLTQQQDLKKWHLSFLPNSTLDSGDPRLVYSYRHAISGFAAKLTKDELTSMEATDGFLSATPDSPIDLLTTYTPTYLGLNKWDSPWKRPNYGEGVIIGVVDTGITPSHPSFHDHGIPPPPRRWRASCNAQCNNKLIGAVGFPSHNSTTDDHDGHGTAVASVAAGNFVSDAIAHGKLWGMASGMAPKSHLSIYRSCIDRVVHATRAIDEAIVDGVDIINLSISTGGTGGAIYGDALAIAAFAAAKKGILTVAAAGNDGPVASTVMNAAPWILTVGSSATDRGIDIKTGSTIDLAPHPRVSYTSGRGPASQNGGIIKPDVIGPGEDIIAASHHRNASSFTVMSGTSMAAAHLSGIAALIKRSHPDWSPAAIKSAIMTTASRLDADGDRMKDEDTERAATLHGMGAGQVEASKANDPGLVYDIGTDGYIPYLCGLGYTDKQVSAIAGGEDISCKTTGEISAEQLNYPSISVSVPRGERWSTVAVKRTVTNVGEAESVYEVMVVQPEGVHVRVQPKELVFRRVGEEKRFRVEVTRNVYYSMESSRRRRVYSEGHVIWVSEKRVVRSPVLINFT